MSKSTTEHRNLFVYPSQQEILERLSRELKELSETQSVAHVALSGGSTPKAWFRYLAETEYLRSISWSSLNFWWVDERAVPYIDEQSNYGEAWRLLFSKLDLQCEQLSPFDTKSALEASIASYSNSLDKRLDKIGGVPVFDWLLLDAGDDGHTASLFPDAVNYDESSWVIQAEHPETKQVRFSFSAGLINAADRVTYLVLGESKADMLAKVWRGADLPAAKIQANNGNTQWFVDAEAARLISPKS